MADIIANLGLLFPCVRRLKDAVTYSCRQHGESLFVSGKARVCSMFGSISVGFPTMALPGGGPALDVS
eukprot:1274478-Amphidinium_carterae.1